MGIVDEDIERVRASSDLVAVVSEHVALRRSGTRWVGLCPFHAEKTPSFSVNSELGLYYCFGCQAKGDAITFVREMNHVDFVGAVEMLAGKAGIQLRYDSGRESGERRRRSVLVEAMDKAVSWYHERLMSASDAAAARGYLRSRGYDGDVVRHYQLGWAPEGWDELVRAVKLPADVLRDAGLAFVNRRDRLQDSFRGRITFPIHDVRGDAVAIGARLMPGGEGPKYKNSPSTSIYDKGEVLYNLHRAKSEIVDRDEVVVCEGYTDVIGFGQAGVGRAVATCGTALTERHVVSLRRFARRVVLAFDADAAGQGAAERFYEWERKHELDVHVAALPEGTDPGDLARSDPEALAAAVAEAQPFLAFRLDRLLGSANLSTPEGRARAAESALALISEHPSELVRDQYLMQVADRCRLEPDQLRARARGGARGPRPPAGSSSGNAAGGRRSAPAGARRMLLRLIVQDPGRVADLVDEVLFEDEAEQGAFRALAASETLPDAIAAADPAAADLLQRLAVEEADVDADDVLALAVREAVWPVYQGLLSELGAEYDDERARRASHVRQLLEQLQDPATRRAAAGQLVAFLSQRAEEVT